MKSIPEITIGSSPLVQDKKTEKANKRLRYLVGPNFKFYYNEIERQYEVWERRGPMFQHIIPIVINGVKRHEITDDELYFVFNFVRRRRKNNDEDYYKYKEYKKWTKPDEYIDPKPKEDLSNWKDSSPRPKDYKRVKGNAVVN